MEFKQRQRWKFQLVLPALVEVAGPADVDSSATTVTQFVPKPTAVDITDVAGDNYDAYTLLGYTATTKSWQWTAGLTDCGITKQTIGAADANGVKYDYYDVSASISNNVQLAQMGQIRFR